MNDEDDWNAILAEHPIFSKGNDGPPPSFTTAEPPGRRQIMLLRDTDLILAMGKEIRICSLAEARNPRVKKTYKTLHTPNIQFDIHQLALNPSGKLLAVAGNSQVGVIVLPRPGLTKLVPSAVDCKSIQVGQFYHASDLSTALAKVEWHPWGEAGTTLMVMTVDGSLREYDISVDPEEPQQVLSFLPERKGGSFLAVDASEREVASFALGKGNADWGPLTVYAVTKSGDIYSVCPYMPRNAVIPSAYLHALEYFIATKEDFIRTSASKQTFTTMYDYQRKYVNALLKQLPPGIGFPGTSHSILMHPPSTIQMRPHRQGPFLLQPSPLALDGSDCSDATDITYLLFSNRDEEDEDDERSERLGVVLVAYQDGKVDVFLDVEKVEARWEMKNADDDPPMFAVYEAIDLGLISKSHRISAPNSNVPLLDLPKDNYPVFFPDPIHDDVVYVSHMCGVHSLHFRPMLQSLAAAMRTENEGDRETPDAYLSALEDAVGATVKPLMDTFVAEQPHSDPIVGATIPSDVLLTYCVFALTSGMRFSSLKLPLRLGSMALDALDAPGALVQATDNNRFLTPLSESPAYVSLLADEPYVPPPALTQRSAGLASKLRVSTSLQGEFMLTPETLRRLGTVIEELTTRIHAIQLGYRGSEVRRDLQIKEFKRQQDTCRELLELVEKLKGRRSGLTQYHLNTVTKAQESLMRQFDRVLQKLMEQASPELSVYETKWFQELRRMKEEVLGIQKLDDGSLVGRTNLLKREYDRILPSFKVMLEKEKERKKKFAEANPGLGVSQAFHFGEISNYERSKITALEDQILALASKLDLTLGRPSAKS